MQLQITILSTSSQLVLQYLNCSIWLSCLSPLLCMQAVLSCGSSPVITQYGSCLIASMQECWQQPKKVCMFHSSYRTLFGNTWDWILLPLYRSSWPNQQGDQSHGVARAEMTTSWHKLYYHSIFLSTSWMLLPCTTILYEWSCVLSECQLQPRSSTKEVCMH